MVALQKMCVFFLLILAGFIAHRKKILDEESGRRISSLVVNIANPALILSSVTSDGGGTVEKSEVILAFGVACILYAALVAVGRFIPYLLRVPKEERNMYDLMFVFSNIGFMGFPLMSALFGNDSLLIGAAFVMAFNILIYTYGIWLMVPEGKERKFEWKKFCNPGVIACIAAIILFFNGIQIRGVLGDTITMLSDLTGPLSMIVIGVSLSVMNFKDIVGIKRLWGLCFLKLLLFAVIGSLLIKTFVSSEMICGVATVVLSGPVASMAVMFAQKYQSNEKLASAGVALSTLLSVLTIPVVFWLV